MCSGTIRGSPAGTRDAEHLGRSPAGTPPVGSRRSEINPQNSGPAAPIGPNPGIPGSPVGTRETPDLARFGPPKTQKFQQCVEERGSGTPRAKNPGFSARSGPQAPARPIWPKSGSPPGGPVLGPKKASKNSEIPTMCRGKGVPDPHGLKSVKSGVSPGGTPDLARFGPVKTQKFLQ